MEDGRTEIAALGEFGLIDHLTKNIDIQNASTIVGVGDDAAVIDHFGKQTVITNDLLVEGVHFDLMYTPLKHLGYKTVVVNVSDIYAMNAMPTQIVIALGFSNRFSLEALDEFYEGIYAACEQYNVDLVGGDTTSSQKGFIISCTAIGEVAPDKFVKRSTAQKGDLLCVTGFLENPKIQPDLEGEKYIVGRILKPEAKKETIKFFEDEKLMPTSMIDVSDGLSSEILHICNQSKVGCIVYEEKIPIAEETRQAAFKFNLDPTACALSGGEDYELLFTIDQDSYSKIKDLSDISIIGYITNEEEGVHILTKGGGKHALTAQGWNAFK
jgi:thiamine-monophosphate kinase